MDMGQVQPRGSGHNRGDALTVASELLSRYTTTLLSP